MPFTPHWPVTALAALALSTVTVNAEDDFTRSVRPILDGFCITCHSTAKQKGELDLERFTDLASVASDPTVWQHLIEQLEFDEMPPKNKPQLSPSQKQTLLNWTRATLRDIAHANAGDPGPVVVRRLSNAEYTHTLRDLTGIPSLDPAHQFPVDGAAGEGFTNTGAALVMSPALFTKYLDAAKQVTGHAVLLPGSISFSEKTTPRDWTEEKLAAIRSLYARYTTTGGGTSVNLQGIKFDTRDGGVIPLRRYLQAIRSGGTPADLSPRYLALLRTALTDTKPSVLLDPVRAHWRNADLDATIATITAWQQALWRFTTIGHIGKRDGPKAWQEPVSPLATSQQVRLKLDSTSIHLTTSGQGTARWQNPTLTYPDQPPIPLNDAEPLAGLTRSLIARELPRTAAYLNTIAESHQTKTPLGQLATSRKLDPALANRWATLVNLGHTTTPKITGLYTDRIPKNNPTAPVRGWGSEQTPSLIVNTSDQPVTITTLTVPPRAVATHPSPTLETTVYWRSPIAANLNLNGLVADVDPNCGNGVTYRLELITSSGTAPLAGGTVDNAARQTFDLGSQLPVKPGDLVKLSIGPRDKQHICDTTHIALTITGSQHTWDLATDIVDHIHDSNPLPDSHGNPDVWHFASSAASPAPENLIPPGSPLARWRESPSPTLATVVQNTLTNSPDDPLLDWNGPLAWLKTTTANFTSNPSDLETTAPSVTTITIPPELAAGAGFTATVSLKSPAGHLQVQALLESPASPPSLTAAASTTKGNKRTWSDGQLPVVSQSPVITNPGSESHRQLTAEIAAFRDLFPAALCYTKIVPVDEVVTLTLFHREDHHLQRLMLTDAETSELDQLWADLHFVSDEPLKLVDVFEQLWQYATQDADPSAFEPLREPIKQRAANFRQTKLDAEPHHLDSLLDFAAKAWRRPLNPSEKSSLRTFYHNLRTGELAHPDAVRLTLARVLTSPAFLYKLETPPAGTGPAPVTNHQLATRLSYFLTSSTPDPELTAAADNLHRPDTLLAQTHRLLKSTKARRLAIEFGTQWLHVRDFDQHDEKSERHFPGFASARTSLNEEPVRFFTDFFQNNRSVLDLIAADHTFVDATLAKHYNFPSTPAKDWTRVTGVRSHGRGGILGFGATLARQSGASRTSPILRGNWISETLLGERLPRPPQDVPVLPEEPPAGLTERQLTEQHSSNPACARCHARIDPLGFSLEAYDAIGRHRTTDANNHPVDASATAPDGTQFTGLEGLRNYLLTHRRQDFLHQFTKKLLGYALGRSVQLSDEPLITSITQALEKNHCQVHTAIELIVQSPQFRQIRGSNHPSP